MKRALTAATALLLGGCLAPTVPLLSRARVADDFQTYAIERVAVLPIVGPRDAEPPTHGSLRSLQDDVVAFIASGTPYEVLRLAPEDLLDLEIGAPRLYGEWAIPALLGIAERFHVDAVIYVEITRERVYPPLAIGAHAEMIAVDTGQVVWNATVELDATDEPVRDALACYYRREDGATDGGTRWEVALSSPRRFARFAAWQLVQQL